MHTRPAATKAELPKPIFFRIKPEFGARLDRVTTDRNSFARVALERAVAVEEVHAQPIPPSVQRAVADAQRLGVNVCAVLKSATKAAIAKV